MTQENGAHVPKWFDETFIRKCLQNHHPNENIEVHSLTIHPASAKGENFLSSIWRLTVTYSDGKVSPRKERSRELICKLALSDPKVRDQLSVLNVYDKEMDMYENILPKLRAILKRCGDDDEIFAETIYVSREDDAIVFDDLVPHGFGMNKRQNGFDREHVEMVLTTLAKYHAANAVLGEKEPNLMKTFYEGIFPDSSGGLTNMFTGQMDTLIEVVSNWPDYQYYANKLKKLRPKLMDKCRQGVLVSPGHFTTLIHGDLWTNNILFAYDQTTNKLKIVALIDFQFCCWASPTLDLHYFFNTSLAETLRLHHQEELVQFYHKKLTESLETVQYKKHFPTLHEIQIQFQEKSFYSMTSALLVQPFMLNEVPVEADINDLYGDRDHERAREFRRLVLSNPKVHQNIRNLLPVFDRRGLLD